MKVIFINGSPRKGWNTHKLLESAMKGAADAGAETELIHLYDYEYKGCISCFACGTVKFCSQLWTPLIMSCCLFIE